MSRERFIRLGAAVGLGSAAVPFLSACGDGGGSAGDGGTPTAGASGGGGPRVGKGQVIVKKSEVGAGKAFPFVNDETGQQSVLVHLESGESAAYSAVCTHQSCTVAYRPQTRKLACPCHGSVFDPAKSAAVETGPARRPLPEVPIRIEGEEVVRV
jgi:Rieske Fe-S protein